MSDPDYPALLAELERYDWPEAAEAVKHLLRLRAQVNQITRWQTARLGGAFDPMGRIHPLTCGNDSNHTILFPLVEDGQLVLVCADCDYRQTNVPQAVIGAHDVTVAAQEEKP